jgi:hypothetical protein
MARSLHFVASLVATLGSLVGCILLCVDVVLRVRRGSVSLLGAPFHVLGDMVLLGFLLGYCPRCFTGSKVWRATSPA